MKFALVLGTAALLSTSLLTSTASAQRSNGSSLFGGSGGGGGSSLNTGGGSMSGGGGGGRSGGSSAFGSSSSGMGGQGRGGSGTGMTGFGNSGFGGSSGIGMVNTMQQNGGFIGANGANAQNFIGRTAQGQGNGGGQGGGNRQQNRGRAGGGNRSMDAELLNSLNGGQAGGTAQQAPVRPRLKTAFEFPAAKVSEVATTARTRFDKLATRHPQLADVEIAHADGGVIVLTGSVGSEASARLAESLLRLEPGVRAVDNQLTFPPTPVE